MKKVAIIGIGHGKFGVRSDASLRELSFEAVKACLDDAGVGLKEVESMVTGIAGDECVACVTTGHLLKLRAARAQFKLE